MSLLDSILGQVGGNIDVGSIAEKFGIDPAMAEKAVAALGVSHAEPGDTLIASTDGVAKTGTDGAPFRAEDVVRVLNQYPHARAAELSVRIIDASEEFRRGRPISDDRTVLVVRWLDSGARSRDLEEVAELEMAAA